MKDRIVKLLNTKMDRKSFLKYVAASGLMVMGGNIILKSISDHLDRTFQQTAKQPTSNGYGSSAYGGQPANKS